MTQRDVILREAGLRDGLQNVSAFFATEAKKAWISTEAAAGVAEIEVCSFVPEKLIPQFKDAAEIVAHSLQIPDLVVSALIPNLKGAQRGFELGVHQLNYVCSVSESHNLRNVRRLPKDSVEDFRHIVKLRDSNPAWKPIKLKFGLATAFGCTIEGNVDPKAVMVMAEEALEAGADAISLADTVGYANPAQIKALCLQAIRAFPGVEIGIHLHDTRGLGLANAAAALDVGIRRLDGTLGGLGGCPYAPGATGNVVFEDMAFMCEAMGLRTGIDLEKLVKVRAIVRAGLPAEEPLHGALARAGVPKGYVPAGGFAQAAE